MTPFALSSLERFQQMVKRKEPFTEAQQAEFEALERDFAREQVDKADNPDTWLTDESRRPQLNGIDWNDANHQMACDEVGNFVKMLVARFGVPLAEAALQAGIAALKRQVANQVAGARRVATTQR